MVKLSIERFREIKNELNEMINFYRSASIYSDTTQMDQKFEWIKEELKNHDLSDIDFSEYKDFVYSSKFDFAGTGANLDFSIINMGSAKIGCLKGCNIKNFDFENIDYEEDSFDPEFVRENSKYFWGLDIEDKSVRDRYYRHKITLVDIKKYDLYDRVEISNLDFRFHRTYGTIWIRYT